MDTVSVRWNGRRQFVGRDAAGHGVVMDAPEGSGGESAGPRPIELVLYALAACSGMDVVSVLEKKRQDVRGLEIEVRGTQREDGYPHYYEEIEVEYIVSGYGVSPAAVERAVQLSEEKYCSVMGMFGEQVKVRTSSRVVEARPAGDPGER